ncbi:hypothetical protein [Bradyrhizobium sp. SZCCHNR1051]|uniref:hypothetical protein n=1 Tax=Bradyrhizobium sp. SZCCHNR1051 TaxID=3057355 RepID=UPI0029162FAD|nr:hypothetical protein [Bradyrhizobium sp. SZCCHNR1051]
MILALRDVRPDFSLADVPRLKATFSRVVPNDPIAPQLILAALEIEAWFVADYSHFARIAPTLTPSYVRETLGIDLLTHLIEAIPEPAHLLNQIYMLAGVPYAKSASDAQRTIDALDFVVILNELPALAPNFAPLRDELSKFLSNPT